MTIQTITLGRDTSFLDSKAKEVTLKKGTALSFSVEKDSVVVYIDDNGDRYMSNDGEFPCKVSDKVSLTRASVLTVLDELGYPKASEYAHAGEQFKLEDGYLMRDGKRYTLESESQVEPVFEYPEIKDGSSKVKASAGLGFSDFLDADKTYSGDDGISALTVLVRQMAESEVLSAEIDSDGSTVVKLGPVSMWPDCKDSEWVDRAFASLPIDNALALGISTFEGEEEGTEWFCLELPCEKTEED